MLQKYNLQTQNELNRDISGDYRGDFFKEAVFYGGTSLKILYGLERFSEDLDFSLLQKNSQFDIEKYYPYIESEFEALGIPVSLSKKLKIKIEVDTNPPFKFQSASKTLLFPITLKY